MSDIEKALNDIGVEKIVEDIHNNKWLTSLRRIFSIRNYLKSLKRILFVLSYVILVIYNYIERSNKNSV